MRVLSRVDLHDILHGCAVLGTGGGGSLEKGLELVDKGLEAGKRFSLVNLGEVPDEGLIACPYMCGSISPLSEEMIRQYEKLPRIDEEPPLRAFKALEEYLGTEIYGVVSTELGGSNTAEALHVAALMERPIIDADPAGRSVPELEQSTLFLNGIKINPVAVANRFGDVAILTHVVDDYRAEVLIRALAVSSQNSVGVAGHVAKGKKVRESVIPGAISFALKVGRVFREATGQGRDVAIEVARATGGFALFKGRVVDFSWRDEGGFTLGEIGIDGLEQYKGSSYRIWFKNENLIAWRNEKVDITAPDLICVFNDEGKPVLNPHYRTGMVVSVIGLVSPDEWRTARGLEVLGPRHFGFDVEYTPIEDKHSRVGG